MIHPKNNSFWQSVEIIYQDLVESISGYQLTVIAGRPESDGEIFFDKFMKSANFLIFNFETGELSLTSKSKDEFIEMLPCEFSALDVFEKYKSLRGSQPIDGVGLFRIQCMFPIDKDLDSLSWNRYQRPIEVLTLARKIPLPVVAFSALNQIGDRRPEKNDLRAEFRILAPLADRICLVHGNGSSALATLHHQSVELDVISDSGGEFERKIT